MVEADSHLKLLPASILNIYKYKVFEHIELLSIGIVAALHSYTYTFWIRMWGTGSHVESK
jgi:hypothetical protein